MKLFRKMKDGGPESTVTGLFVVEIKKLFSIVLLKFSNGSRDAYHNHAFNSMSWILKGELRELPYKGSDVKVFKRRLLPIITTRKNFHQVRSVGDSYVLSFRGRWKDEWQEYIPGSDAIITLTHGRKVVRTMEPPNLPYKFVKDGKVVGWGSHSI